MPGAIGVPLVRRIHLVWLAGLLLKGIGATWDISWHFMVLRESFSPPHVVNLLGNGLVFGAFAYEWRHRTPERTPGLLVILAGALMFLVAIPFDEWWHRAFGLDLTTWSPSHLLLFYGTSVGCTGILLLFLADAGWRPGEPLAWRRLGWADRSLFFVLVLFVAMSALFPLGYNEYTTVAVETARVSPESMDPALLEIIHNAEDPVFLGTPPWLYPVYSLGVCVLVATLLRRLFDAPGWIAPLFASISLVRWGANGILVAAGWAGAVVPWQYALMGFAFEAAWLVPVAKEARAALGAGAMAAAGYAYFVLAPSFLLAIPLDASSWPAGVLVAFAGAALAWWLWSLSPRLGAGSGMVEAISRRWDDAWDALARRAR